MQLCSERRCPRREDHSWRREQISFQGCRKAAIRARASPLRLAVGPSTNNQSGQKIKTPQCVYFSCAACGSE